MGLGRPFRVGNQEGKGRPRGSRNKLTLFQRALEKDGLAILETIKQQALKSDPTAMRLCMERLVPIAKAPRARFELPPIEKAADLTQALAAVASEVADGELSAQEGEAVAKMIESQRRLIESAEFEARLKALEEGQRKLEKEKV